jgi:hypothetical protein
MNEVVQHAAIKVHPQLVKHRLEASVEGLMVLAYHVAACALLRARQPGD